MGLSPFLPISLFFLIIQFPFYSFLQHVRSDLECKIPFLSGSGVSLMM